MAPEAEAGAPDPAAASPPSPARPAALPEPAARPPAWLVVLCTVLAGLALAWLSNFLDGQETLKRLAARSYAPLLSEAYGPAGQNLITVLTVDDGDLKEYGLSWPVPLEFHGRLIQRVARQHPRAVFLDVVFLDNRPPEQVQAFGDAVCAVAASGVPVFYASYARTDLSSNVELMLSTRRLPAPPGTGEGAPAAAGPLCARPVRAHLLHDRLDQHLWNYALNAPPGEAIDPQRPRPPGSAALTLYCLHDPGRCPKQTEEPMALLWPTRAEHGNPRIFVRANQDGELESVCRGEWHWSEAVPFNGLARRAWAWLQASEYRKPAPLCPYNKVLPASAFKGIGFDAAELRAALHGRYVLIGANLAAVGDQVLSPVHGRLPGVHAHAVALDNLISLDGRYLGGGEVAWPWQDGRWVGVNQATRFALFSVSLVALVMIPLTRAMRRGLARRREAVRDRPYRTWRFLQRESWVSRRLPLRGLAWLLLLWLALWLLVWVLGHWGVPMRLVWLPPMFLAYLMLVHGQPVFGQHPLHRLVLLQRVLEVLAYSLVSTLIVVLGFYAFHQGPLVIVEYLGLAALSGLLGWGEKLARNAQAAFAALGQQNPVLAWNRHAAARAAQGSRD